VRNYAALPCEGVGNGGDGRGNGGPRRYRAREFEAATRSAQAGFFLLLLLISLSLFTRQNTVNRVMETRAKDIIVRLYDILGRCVDFMRANANVLALIALMRVDRAHVHARTLTSPVSSPLPSLRAFPLFHSAGGGLACSQYGAYQKRSTARMIPPSLRVRVSRSRFAMRPAFSVNLSLSFSLFLLSFPFFLYSRKRILSR